MWEGWVAYIKVWVCKVAQARPGLREDASREVRGAGVWRKGSQVHVVVRLAGAGIGDLGFERGSARPRAAMLWYRISKRVPRTAHTKCV